METKNYDWEHGPELKDHTKKKHKILAQYFREYLIIRCQLPKREKFRLAIVDGFCGAGLYKCNSFGSPLIFLDVLKNTTKEINLHRQSQGIRPIQIECLLILNDENKQAIELLRANTAPFLAAIKDENENLYVELEFFNSKFELLYPQVKQKLLSARCSNVLFNLDQCGYSLVSTDIIKDIMKSWDSAEILLTFMISSMLTFLSQKKEASGVPLEPEVKTKIDALLSDANLLEKKQWMGEAEKIVYMHLEDCASYVSPFSIKNPKGWRYWFMHFANRYRARQAYNDILHRNALPQAHFGRAGLHMLSYDPKEEGMLYLFDDDSRQSAKENLYDDIPRFIAESGDALLVQDFYATAYSKTPAHSDDIHEMIIENPDMEVITEAGGKRRQANTIKPSDTLKLNSQKSMFFMFSNFSKKQ